MGDITTDGNMVNIISLSKNTGDINSVYSDGSDIYMQTSEDNGLTFLPAVKIDEVKVIDDGLMPSIDVWKTPDNVEVIDDGELLLGEQQFIDLINKIDPIVKVIPKLKKRKIDL